MALENTSPYLLCKVLQSLVSVTLNNVIIPLRKELKRCNLSLEIINLEIQDAENKTYEYMAQQISVICNADEDTANMILREFPKSATCFKCLGIHDDTSQGLLRIRGIGFLQLLDMTDDEVSGILRKYGDSPDEIEHVLAGLAKVRSNIDLIESSIPFDDDTRNLIKLVVRLTKEDENDYLSTFQNVLDHATAYDTRVFESGKSSFIPNGENCSGAFDFECNFRVSTFGRSDQTRSGDLGCLHPCDIHVSAHNTGVLHSPKSAIAPMGTSPHTTDSFPVPSLCSTRMKYANGSHGLGHTEALQTYFPWDLDFRLTDGGLSVPTTPIWNGKNGPMISPLFSKCDRALLAFEDTSPLRSHRSHPNTIHHQTRYREHHPRQPVTPPPKHRLRLLFPLHRCNSHESNLSNRLTPLVGSSSNTCYPPRELAIKHNPGAAAFPFDCSSVTAMDTICHDSCFLPPVTYCKAMSNAHQDGCAHDAYANDLKYDVLPSRRVNTSAPGTYTCGSIGRISSDHRSSKTLLQPPTLTTTPVDVEAPLATSSFLGSISGASIIPSSNGFSHRFEAESKIGTFLRRTPCAVCSNRMSLRLQHCLHCRIKVHKSCLPQTRRLRCVAPGQFIDGSDAKGSPVATCKTQVNTNMLSSHSTSLRPAHSTPAFQGSESTSLSSCTSSAPGSPFGVGASLLSTHSISQAGVDILVSAPLGSPSYATPMPSSSAATPSSCGLPSGRLTSPITVHPNAISAVTSRSHSPLHMGHVCNRFDFSVHNQNSKDAQPLGNAVQDNAEVNRLTSTQSSADSDRTVSDGATRRFHSMDSQDESGNLVRVNSISVTLKEWEIPMENLIKEDIIGQGTFGTVYRADWHGKVAVKVIDVDPEDVDGSARLESFKREVAIMQKTRHENLVLFMGACMKPPDLAIVTQLSQGDTLYQQLHHRDTSIPVNRIINIATQIAKGMGYLHAKGIVHRDLKTRNIFVESNFRVVIGDFGVFNCVHLYKKAKWGNYLNIPPFWLCYVAPEVIQTLKINYASTTNASDLPLSTSSDVFAFGTVWYELLTNEFPFKGCPTETVVYLCGRGFRQNLRIPGPKDFKEILVQCWAYAPSRRPEFTTLVKMLDKLPKLHRSPSYPIKPPSALGSCSHDALFV